MEDCCWRTAALHHVRILPQRSAHYPGPSRETTAMANGLCDICGVRPATVRAQVVSNGQRQTLELCDVDYRRLARQQGRSSSPLEALFGGGRGNSLFDDFFNDDFWGGRFPSRTQNADQAQQSDQPGG